MCKHRRVQSVTSFCEALALCSRPKGTHTDRQLKCAWCFPHSLRLSQFFGWNSNVPRAAPYSFQKICPIIYLLTKHLLYYLFFTRHCTQRLAWRTKQILELVQFTRMVLSTLYSVMGHAENDTVCVSRWDEAVGERSIDLGASVHVLAKKINGIFYILYNYDLKDKMKVLQTRLNVELI